MRPRTRRAWTGWHEEEEAEEDEAESSGATSVGEASLELRKCCWLRGEGGESRGSPPRVSSSEMLLARRPRPLGGRMSGEGGDGERLGERGHGTLEMCSTAVHLERGLLLRKWNLEVKVVTLRRRETEMEDLDVEEIVEGECLRLGVSLTSSRV